MIIMGGERKRAPLPQGRGEGKRTTIPRAINSAKNKEGLPTLLDRGKGKTKILGEDGGYGFLLLDGGKRRGLNIV